MPDIFNQDYAAFLFDMDGTLLNSIAIVERVWAGWAERNGIEPRAFLQTIHGMRAVDVVTREALPGLDPLHEAALLLEEELADVDGILLIAGILEFLAKLPAERWAIVTSAPRSLALRRMAAVGIPMPKVLICAEDIVNGKPDPTGYKLGAEKLGFDASDCVVFEDAPAGILAGERAGAKVVVINTTHEHVFDTAHLSIASYDELTVVVTEQGRLKLA
jgi:sugar-phosphatase